MVTVFITLYLYPGFWINCWTNLPHFMNKRKGEMDPNSPTRGENPLAPEREEKILNRLQRYDTLACRKWE